MTDTESVGSRAFHPGKVRGLQRIASRDGFFLVCALDHLTDFAELVGSGRPRFDELVAAKAVLVEGIRDLTSAVLVDAYYGVGYLAAVGALPPGLGLLVSMEDGDYAPKGPHLTQMRVGWDVGKARSAGVDAAKLLWWYRPDDAVLAARQRDSLATLVSACAADGMPLVVEPIWYPLDGEDVADPAWRARRAEGIVESVITADRLGADLLKVEFPTDLNAVGGETRAMEILTEVDRTVGAPWVVLSAGVPFDVFLRQVDVACRCGASGYIAGRSLWREAVAAGGEDGGRAMAATRERLRLLNTATRAHGRPFLPRRDVRSAIAALPEGWYVSASGRESGRCGS